MTYDYHGQWDKKTGHIAPMYAREEDDDSTFNAVSFYIRLDLLYLNLINYEYTFTPDMFQRP